MIGCIFNQLTVRPSYYGCKFCCLPAIDFSAALSHALSSVGKQDLVPRDKQVKALRCLCDGKDVFLWVPTSYGKSLCYQALPFLFDAKYGRLSAPQPQRSVVLVVSSLLSDGEQSQSTAKRRCNTLV